MGDRRRRVKWAAETATSTVGQAPKTVECSRATSSSLLEPAAMRNALHRGEETEPPSAATGMPKAVVVETQTNQPSPEEKKSNTLRPQMHKP